MPLKIFCFLLLLSIYSPHIQAQQQHEAYANAIEKFQRYYNEQRADSLYELFSIEQKEHFSFEQIVNMINSMQQELGKLKTYSNFSETKANVIYMGEFEKKQSNIILVLDGNNHLATIQLVPIVKGVKKSKEGKSLSNFKVTVLSGDTLYGELLMPVKSENKPNVVLIIAGSGPTDRNCNNSMGLITDAYQMLADSLKSAGIASVRYDKRGSGESISFMAVSEEYLRFEDMVNDAVLFVKKIKAENKFNKIFIAGHSEGSLVGILLANKESVDGFISIAGVGENVSNAYSRQLKSNMPKSGKLIDSVLNQLKNGVMVNIEDENVAKLFRPKVQPYLISWMAYEPQEEIKKLTIPVLILQGNTDLQVLVSDAEKLRQAKPTAKYYIIDGMNHMLKNSSSDRNENLATYNNPMLPIDSDLCAAIIQFCK